MQYTIPPANYFPFLAGEEQMKALTAKIRGIMRDYVSTSRLQSLVLGISGGIDSALCAALLRPVCEEIARSIAVGEAFCHDFQHIDITETFLANKELLIHYDDSQLSKLRQGNMKARMRMMVLFDLAQLYHGMVISTDNYTEYLTGFWTLHGDVGDYAPMQHLWKTEVYALANFLLAEETPEQQAALQSCIDATPVDGLGISNSDCEQLGVPNYFEADRIFAAYFQGDESLLDHPLIKRYRAAEFKRHNPACILRDDLI